MKVDVLVVINSWWRTAWGFIIEGKKVISIYENPYNVYARGEKREEKVGCLKVGLYENQTLEVWTLEELLEFLQTLDELNDDVEVEISEEVYPQLSTALTQNVDVRWWTTSYCIYM